MIEQQVIVFFSPFAEIPSGGSGSLTRTNKWLLNSFLNAQLCRSKILQASGNGDQPAG
jgi:hypothetical protein